MPHERPTIRSNNTMTDIIGRSTAAALIALTTDTIRPVKTCSCIHLHVYDSGCVEFPRHPIRLI
jgi:hypothetical protein